MTREQDVWTWVMNWPADKALVMKPDDVSALKSTLRELRDEVIRGHDEIQRLEGVLSYYDDEAEWRTRG